MKGRRKTKVRKTRKTKKQKRQLLKGGSNPVKIAFYSNHLGERGTEVAMYDYAYYNSKLLNNTSIVIYNKNNDLNNDKVINKFKKEFDVFEISDNMKKDEIDRILSEQKCDIIYMIVRGDKFDIPTKAKVCIHCVFICESPPFGNVYASISPGVEGNNGKYPVVPHMINLPSHNRNMRAKLSIPNDAIVFGRYGGKDTFDIGYVQTIVCDVAKSNKNIYFLFGNTDVFCESMPNIIHLDTISELDEKVEFINTCDAMLWARVVGETFGLAIGEFSSKNKPVFVTDNVKDKAHVEILKDKGIWYTEATLKDLLIGFNKETYKNKDLNAYNDYTPEKVMEQFKNVFIESKGL